MSTLKHLKEHFILAACTSILVACGGGGGGSPSSPNTPPAITSGANTSVPENSSQVLTVSASDQDSDALRFSLTGGTDQALFSINATTGDLGFIIPPDFENPSDTDADNVYDIQVSVSDGTDSSSQAITVTITNVNDIAPVFSSSATTSISENTTSITTITAYDTEGDTVTYAITGGADQSSFTLNNNTGALSFTSAPNFELALDANSDNIYEVQVSASDGVNSSLQNISVSINNTNEPPAITSSNSASIAENTTAALTVVASDPDGPALTYTLSGGLDQTAFTINASSGALSFVTAPDYEAPTDADANNSYLVQVSASDGTLSVSQSITVTVTNANDNAPVLSFSAPSIPENNTIVMTITASDADGDSLTYSIAGGTDQAAFAINATSGVLSFKTAPDFENPTDADANNIYSVQIVASDGLNAAGLTTDVIVTDVVDEAAPTVLSVTPVAGASAVDSGVILQAVFSEALDCTTVTSSSFTLFNNSGSIVPGVVGCSNDTVTFDPTSGSGLPKDNYRAVLGTSITDLSGNPLSASYQWTFSTNGWTVLWGTSTTDYIADIDADANGNLYTVGYTQGTFVVNQGGFDYFITSYAPDGTQRWNHQSGTTGNELAEDIVTDSTGNSYVVGYTTGIFTGNTASGGDDYFVMKYNSTGQRQWVRQQGSAGKDRATGVALDSQNNVYVIGVTDGASLNGQISSGGEDMFISKFDSNGLWQWTRLLGSSTHDGGYGKSVAVDNTDNVYVAGYTVGAIDGQTQIGILGTDVFLTKYNSSGVKQWTRQWGGASNDYPRAITIDNSNNIFITGYGLGMFDGVVSAWQQDNIFVTKFASDGTKQWTRLLGTDTRDIGSGITTDGTNIYITGNTQAAIDGQTYIGGMDIYITSYDGNGNRLWTRQTGATTPNPALNDEGSGIIYSGGNLYITGTSTGNLDGNNNTGSFSSDAFIMKYTAAGAKQ